MPMIVQQLTVKELHLFPTYNIHLMHKLQQIQALFKEHL